MRILMCCLSIVFLLTSCGTSKQASPSQQSQKQMNTVKMKTHDSTGNKTTNIAPYQTDVSLQSHLESLVNRVPGVESAHCVVMGKTAVVGINVPSKLDRAEVGNIKYTVAEALRKDPRGANAIVTADIDLSTRIEEIGKHIRQGHPISGFATELADIVGRIVPQLPKDIKTKDVVPHSTQNHPHNKSTREQSNKKPSGISH